MHETLRRSSIGEAAAGSPVNLERAMAANSRFGGHIVTGHIDGTGTICEVKSDEIAVCYSIKAPEKIMHYIVEKGSVAVDGISLTVAKRHRPLLWCLSSHIRRSVQFLHTKRREIR